MSITPFIPAQTTLGNATASSAAPVPLPIATPPAIAAAAGYNLLTFGPKLLLGVNWFPFNFFSSTPAVGQALQNSDGSVVIPGSPSGNSYGGGICTCKFNNSAPFKFNGIAIGGGAYIEATFSFTGAGGTQISGNSPAFWSNDVEHMSGGISTQWPGQAPGFNHWIEVDFMELDSGTLSKYGFSMHDDYGSNLTVNPPFTGPAITPLSTASDWSVPHTYGFLWIPATVSTNGTGQFFFDGVQVGSTVTWSLNNDGANSPPPSGSQIASILDLRHLALILGTERSGAASASQNTSTGVFATASQNFAVGQIVYLVGAIPGGFTVNVPYYVLSSNLTSTTCELSATAGGAAIIPSSSAACTICFPAKPLRVYSCCVWQASTAGNLVQ